MVLYDLRYSAADLGEAARASRRPQPRRIRRTVAVYAFPRYAQDRSVAESSTRAERRERQRLRTRTGLLLRLLHSAPPARAAALAGLVDVAPARHRRSSLWLA
ncbi:hypothetical protein LG634_30115 [Streptomyces bambusae]|uniref:hypothetical protein n=1 Tax=Streptomyces bambusae TaxID=1550616 RepID=UPI001CFCB4C3|nr:hypothetical protein [Streptomyces bambusae]MCB5169055.1 hypothetical protein [Streptomyces bambusae]